MFKKIPKKMHFYWEGKDFSYLHYLSIKSFVDWNPLWECIVHTNKEGPEEFPLPWSTGEQGKKYTGKNYFSMLDELNITLREFDFTSIGVSPSMHPVQKSDILRWYLLSTEGGGWSDFDIIYTKPVNMLREQTNMDMDCCVCIADVPYKHHIIGFYLASENNKFFADIYEKAHHPEYQDYQMFGNKLLGKHYPTIESIRNKFPEMIIENLNKDALYPYNWLETPILFKGIGKKHNQRHIIGVHWYNGATDSRDFINTFDENSIGNLPDSTIMRLVRDAPSSSDYPRNYEG